MAAPAGQGPGAHTELATRIGTAITQELWKLLPQIAEAFGEHGLPQASFNAEVIFRNGGAGAGLSVEIKTEKHLDAAGNVLLQMGWLGREMALMPEAPQQPMQPPQPAAAAGYAIPGMPPPPNRAPAAPAGYGHVPMPREPAAVQPPQHAFRPRPRLADE